MPWKYDQSSGELSYNGVVIGTGYAGKGIGKNNYDSQGGVSDWAVLQERYGAWAGGNGSGSCGA